MGTEGTKVRVSDKTEYIGEVNQKGEAHGKGSVYFQSNHEQKQIYTFKGIFQSGEPIHGEAKVNSLIYEGQVKERSFTGKGKLTDLQTKLTYEGQFLNGNLVEGVVTKKQKFTCKGKYLDCEKSEDEILCQAKTLSGQGWHQNLETSQKWQGTFQNGNMNGEGNYKLGQNLSYEGSFHTGRYHGKGKYLEKSGEIGSAEGNFKWSFFDGQQEKLTFRDGTSFKGSMKDHEFSGNEQEFIFADGTCYKGGVNNGGFSGECEISYHEKSPIQFYRGQIHDGKYNGLGVVEYRNGLIIKGYFFQNAKNGPCILVYGSKTFKGLFIMDKLISGLQEIERN